MDGLHKIRPQKQFSYHEITFTCIFSSHGSILKGKNIIFFIYCDYFDNRLWCYAVVCSVLTCTDIKTRKSTSVDPPDGPTHPGSALCLTLKNCLLYNRTHKIRSLIFSHHEKTPPPLSSYLRRWKQGSIKVRFWSGRKPHFSVFIVFPDSVSYTPTPCPCILWKRVEKAALKMVVQKL